MTRRIGDMTQKQILVAVVSALIVGWVSQYLVMRDSVLKVEQTVESRTPLISEYKSEMNSIKIDIVELQRRQGLVDLELSYSRQDRETSDALVKQNLELLNRVDKALTTFTVRMDGELSTLKKSVEDLDERLDKAGY